MPIKHILVPTDFSEPSNAALDYGVNLARKLRARLSLLHVLEPQPVLEGATEEDIAADQERRKNAVQDLEALLGPEDEDDLNLQVAVRAGNARNEIHRSVEELQADLVVMGTHGRGRFGRLILGSTTEALLRHLNVPVLTVCHASSPTPVRRILLATDLSEASLHAFDFALDMARTLGAEIVALHALGGPVLASGELGMPDREQVKTEAGRRLATLVSEGRRYGVEIRTLIAEGSAAPEILRASAENGADMILMAIDKKGFIERVLLGTTAEQVVRESRLPVLCVPMRVAATS